MFSGDRAGAIVVVTALEAEYDAMRQHLRNVHPHVHKSGTVFETGELGHSGRRIALLITGPGNQPAAVLTERAINEFAPVAVLVVGIAGAIDPEIDLGDVVVGTKVYFVHGGKEDSTGHKARPDSWPASHALEQLAHLLARTPTWSESLAHRPEVRFQPIAAGEVVLNSRESPLAHQIDQHYNDAAAIEMESAGVAAAAHRNDGLQMLTIRGISDKADGTMRPVGDMTWQQVAATNAAAFAAALADRLVSPRVEAEPAVDDRTALVLPSLAMAVEQQWKAEQERRSIRDPGPLPLRWAVPGGQSGRFDELGLFFAGLRAHRLVILGPSGSGKTASLGQLVLDLLALRSAHDPVPVFFSLGAWDPAKQRLPEWMTGQLVRDHPRLGRKVVSGTGAKRTVAAALVEAGRILPVLDGLDEVPEPMRGKAIDAINRLGYDLPLVVTSRIGEYRDALRTAERELTGAVTIELQPLDPADVCEYLAQGTGDRWHAVTRNLAAHPDGPLARVLTTPLMVWLARVAYGAAGADPGVLCGFTQAEAIENDLLDHLVPAVYPEHPTPGGPGRWIAVEARHWLKFLAGHLVKGQQRDLVWWRLDESVPRLDSICRMLAGSTMGIGAAMAGAAPPAVVVVMAAVCATMAGSRRYLGFVGVDIEELGTPRAFRGDWRIVRKEIRDAVVILVMTAATLFFILFTWVASVRVPLNTFRAIALYVVVALVTLALVAWWVVRWVRKWRRRKQPRPPGSMMAIESDRAVSVSSTLRSDRTVALSSLVFYPALLILIAPIPEFFSIAAPFLIVPSIGMVMMSAYFRFSVTRVVLALRGRLPWRLMRFLEDAHERGVLRQVGAVYQFRHDRLKDRLSA